jgi:hypothetical protein
LVPPWLLRSSYSPTTVRCPLVNHLWPTTIFHSKEVSIPFQLPSFSLISPSFLVKMFYNTFLCAGHYLVLKWMKYFLKRVVVLHDVGHFRSHAQHHAEFQPALQSTTISGSDSARHKCWGCPY